MKSTDQTTASPSSEVVATASALRKLYFTRAAFSIIWIILVVTLAKTNAAIATILFIIYPAWDFVATLFDIKANPPTVSKTPQYVNAAISVITTVAVIVALQKDFAAAFVVFGSWAILTGAIQLVLGLRRRKIMGGQWPMIISGAQSMLAGVSIIVKAHVPNAGVNTLAGYAAFGAFYFILTAVMLSKTIKKADTATA